MNLDDKEENLIRFNTECGHVADEEVAPVRVRIEDVRLAGSYNFARLNIVVMLRTNSNVDFTQDYVASAGHPKSKDLKQRGTLSCHCLRGTVITLRTSRTSNIDAYKNCIPVPYRSALHESWM